jgi:hypothetical protein
MSRNCSIEVDGLHYVFGKQDFYIHDGTSKPQSIADGRVRNSVFGSINLSAAKQCFIAHDPYQHEVLFCYQSSDSDVRFPGAAYCNKAAVWNYRSGTFSFRELPNVRAWTVASVSTVNTWATDPPTKTWANSGGSWLDQNDGAKPALLLTGNTLSGLLTDARIYAVDPVFRGSRVILPVDTEANTPAYLEHGGVDLDEADIPLQVYKWVRNVYPQVRVVSGGPVTIRVGAAALNSLSPTYVSAKQFNPATDYQISARASGRYIALRVEIPTLTDFDITGFDLEVLGGGRR